jgi:hypothetical protein
MFIQGSQIHSRTKAEKSETETLRNELILFQGKNMEEFQFCQVLWLMPVILSTWESETGRIEISGQPRQNKLARTHLSGKKLGVVECPCQTSSGGKHSWVKHGTLSPKQQEQKRLEAWFKW